MTKHVLITGSSSGIGRSCSLHLALRGWTVHAGVRKAADGESLRREAKGEVRPIAVDVTDADAIHQAAAEMAERVGSDGLAGLVNNAGMGVNGPVELVPIEGWRLQFEVNLFGQIAVTQAMLSLLRLHADRVGRARIVMMSSIGGRIGQPVLGPYCASKFALEAASDALRYELGPQRIQVSIVEPGAIKSEIWRKGQEEVAAKPLGPEGARYLTVVNRVIELARKAEEGAIPALKVARVVEHCLTAKRPPIRLLVGRDAHALAVLKRVLPGRMFDWGLRRFVGL